MALGIETYSVEKHHSIPLFGMHDPNWEDNTWICEHLRHLADHIEQEKLKIYKVSLDFDKQYKSPNLTIITLC